MNNQSDYLLRQKAEDYNYKLAYEEWISSLSPEDRASLPPGLDKPHIESQGVGAPELDESRLVGEVGWGVPSEVEHEGGADFGDGRESLQDSLRVMIAELFESKTPSLTIGVIGCALRVDGCAAKKVAKRHKKRAAWVRDESMRMRFRMAITCLDDELALSKVAGELASTANTRLSLEVLALVSGICYQGMSQTAIADRHGVTRAAVSKRCVELTEKLGLPPSRAMKSEASREVYAEAQRGVWREGRRPQNI